jgi:hypothetical protein
MNYKLADKTKQPMLNFKRRNFTRKTGLLSWPSRDQQKMSFPHLLKKRFFHQRGLSAPRGGAFAMAAGALNASGPAGGPRAKASREAEESGPQPMGCHWPAMARLDFAALAAGAWRLSLKLLRILRMAERWAGGGGCYPELGLARSLFDRPWLNFTPILSPRQIALRIGLENAAASQSKCLVSKEMARS